MIKELDPVKSKNNFLQISTPTSFLLSEEAKTSLDFDNHQDLKSNARVVKKSKVCLINRLAIMNNSLLIIDQSNGTGNRKAGQLVWSEDAPLVNVLGESPNFIRHRKNLPFYQYRREILDQILDQQVVIIAGETGCGKTTQLPQYILEEAYETKKPCRIICVQPHRILTVAAANRVTAERGM